MRIKYFEDTDTTLVELSTNPPVETQELNEYIYIDLDDEWTCSEHHTEHAGQSADMREFSTSVPADLPAS
jgi:uncharacterized protein YuzE